MSNLPDGPPTRSLREVNHALRNVLGTLIGIHDLLAMKLARPDLSPEDGLLYTQKQLGRLNEALTRAVALSRELVDHYPRGDAARTNC